MAAWIILRTGAVAVVACALAFSTFGQAPRITSFTPDGVLVCTNLAPGTQAWVEWCCLTNQWQDLQSATVDANGTIQTTVPITPALPAFFRVRAANSPAGMALIPAGTFQMGGSFSEGYSDELPVHSVYVSAFFMDRCEVTKALWEEVYNWAITNGYRFDYGARGKAATHPAHSMTWHDAVKWCNARSEKEKKTPAYYTDSALTQPYRTGQVILYVSWRMGYRLPTEAEWEKAARGGASGRRFPWSDSDTIQHSRANFYSSTSYSYDTSPTRGYHPSFNDGVQPYTSPVGSFAPNGYGLYDMAGNVWEWCWDVLAYYSSASQSDPTGPASSEVYQTRALRGGSYEYYGAAYNCRTATRYLNGGSNLKQRDMGFRCVWPIAQ